MRDISRTEEAPGPSWAMNRNMLLHTEDTAENSET